MWLAAADPQTRHGIVAGFISTDRGSGVVYGQKTNKELEIGAEAQCGRLTLQPEKSAEPEIFVIGYFDDVRDGLESWADLVDKGIQ